jgi:hypothetical protein
VIDDAYRKKWGHLRYRKGSVRARLEALHLELDYLAKASPLSPGDAHHFRYEWGADEVMYKPAFMIELLEDPNKFVEIAKLPTNWWWVFYCTMRNLTPEMFAKTELTAFDNAISGGEFGRRYAAAEKRESGDDE